MPNGRTLQWIGYSDRRKEGHWVDHLGNEGKMINWHENQPDNAGGHQDCAVLNWFGHGKVDDQRQGYE